VAILLIAAIYKVLEPFIVPVVWAGVVALMTHGLYLRLLRYTHRPHLTAIVLTVFLLMFLAGLAGALVASLASQTIHLMQVVQDWLTAGAHLPDWLSHLDWVGPRIENLRQRLIEGSATLGPELTQFGQSVSQGLLRFATDVAGNLFGFFITIVTLCVFYVEGEHIVVHARHLLAYLFPHRPADFLDEIGRVVRAVVVGVVGTAVLIGLAAGIGYAIFGVPDAVALGAVTTVVSLLPAGTVVMWVGAVIWLFFQNEIWNAVGMTIWGLVIVGMIDNFMRPILIRRSGSVHIPFLLILFGVLGGLWAFGLLGLLLGPVVLTVGFALIADLPGQREPTPGSAHADSSSDGTAS
ncbi:MAG: AI-2E family transporter, partial [Myxococcota bacterium]